MKLYSVYDEVAQTFNAPFPEANNQSAIRAFQSVCLDSGSLLSKYPSDYYLYAIGEMDEHTGEINSSLPERLCRGTDFVDRVEFKEEV